MSQLCSNDEQYELQILQIDTTVDNFHVSETMFHVLRRSYPDGHVLF